MDFLSGFYQAVPAIIALIFSVSFHEAAHGFVAKLFGDLTADRLGRITLNPIKHIDPIGSIVLPGFLLMVGAPIFAWAKPVPVDFAQLKPARLGMILVALAGPMTNFLLAIISGLLLHINLESHTLGNDILTYSLRINCFLGVLNLIPIPPLDGGRVMLGLLPKPLAEKFATIEPYGTLILLALILMPGQFIWRLMAPVLYAVQVTVLFLSGHGL